MMMETTIYRLDNFNDLNWTQRSDKRAELQGIILKIIQDVWPGVTFLAHSEDMVELLEPFQFHVRFMAKSVIITDAGIDSEYAVHLPYDKDFTVAEYRSKLLALIERFKVINNKGPGETLMATINNWGLGKEILKMYKLSTPVSLHADSDGIVLTLSDHTKQAEMGKLMIHINRSDADTIVNHRSTFQLLPSAFMFSTREYKFEEYWGADSDMIKIYKGLITQDTDHVTSLIHTVTSLKHLAHTMIDKHTKPTAVTEDM